MIVSYSRIITLPSGNTARKFRFHDRGNGHVQVTYEYTDRRRNHQVSRYFLAEFMYGHLQSITARSANGGRVECFSSSIILDVLHEMLAEVSKANEALTDFRKDAAAMRATETETSVETNEQDDTDLKDTVELLRGVVMINMIITLVTLGIVWYNL